MRRVDINAAAHTARAETGPSPPEGSCNHIGACHNSCIASQVKGPPLVAFHPACDSFPRGPMTLETTVLEFNASALRCLFVEPDLDLTGHFQVRLYGPFRADIPTEDNATGGS
jgi:hypothetical protein